MIYRFGAKMSKSKGNVVVARRARSSATAPTRCGSTSCSWGRPTRTRSGRTRASRGCGGSCRGSGGSCTRRSRAAQPPGDGPTTPLARKAHETIDKVTDDIERRFVFNTPIAAVMELVNEISRGAGDPAARFAAETAVSLIQPYAPHIAEELWSRLGHSRLWERAVAGRRRVDARARHGRARLPGERQGARPAAGRRPGLPRRS